MHAAAMGVSMFLLLLELSSSSRLTCQLPLGYSNNTDSSVVPFFFNISFFACIDSNKMQRLVVIKTSFTIVAAYIMSVLFLAALLSMQLPSNIPDKPIKDAQSPWVSATHLERLQSGIALAQPGALLTLGV